MFAQARVEEAWAAGTKALADAETSLGDSRASNGDLALGHEASLVVRTGDGKAIDRLIYGCQLLDLTLALSCTAHFDWPQTRRQELRHVMREQLEELVGRKIGAWKKQWYSRAWPRFINLSIQPSSYTQRPTPSLRRRRMRGGRRTMHTG